MTDSLHNYSELIELAVLDAHGLLDPIESELFNRSFHNAPASVQDEIVRLQHRLATDESLLPSDLPPASLKGKVIDAVAKAADTEAKRLAPLALIGARVGADNPPVGISDENCIIDAVEKLAKQAFVRFHRGRYVVLAHNQFAVARRFVDWRDCGNADMCCPRILILALVSVHYSSAFRLGQRAGLDGGNRFGPQ